MASSATTLVSSQSSGDQGADQFKIVLQAFMQDVSDDVRQDLKNIKDAASLHQALEKIQQEQAKSTGLRAMSKIKPFIDFLQQFSGVVETLVTIYPEVLAAIWGPLKFLIQIANNYHKAFDDVVDTVAEIGRRLPIFEEYSKLFEGSKKVTTLLTLFYKDVLDFYAVLIEFFRIKGWKIFYELLWPRYSKKLRVIRQNIADHKELMDDQVTLEEMREAKNRADKALIEYERAERIDEQNAYQNSRTAISPPSYDERLVDIQSELAKETCRWINHDAIYKSWIRSQMASTSVLWLCGMPGAGKTHIAARVVESLRHAGHTVLFAFLNWQGEDVTWTEILHSMIFQLVDTDNQLRSVVNQEFDENYRNFQASASFNEDLLQRLLLCNGPAFIVVDGLDEVNQKARKDVLNGILGLVDKCDGLRVFCSSREEYDISTLIKTRALTLRVEEKNFKDIRLYIEQEVKAWLDRLQDEEGLDDEDRQEIELQSSQIPAKAKGMFLYARIILDYLRSSPNLMSLNAEIKNLPEDLNNAYERIIQRCSVLGEETFKITKLIFAWIGCSTTPLRNEEIIQALTIDDEQMRIDHRRRPLNKDLRYFCGPLIEDKDGLVNFVHFTAKAYIFGDQDNDGKAWLHHSEANLKVTQMCLAYLMIPEITLLKELNDDLTANADDLHKKIVEGKYVLFTYVMANWTTHITQVYAAVKDPASLHRIALMLQLVLKSRNRPKLPGQRPLNVKKSAIPKVFEVIERAQPELYKQFCQVIVADATADIEISKHPLILKECWRHFMKTYHSLICPRSAHGAQCCCEKLATHYGSQMWKCNNLQCKLSRLGVPSITAFQRHIATHDRKFKCSLPECKWRAPFTSQKQLEQHTALLHLRQPVQTSGQITTTLRDIDTTTLEQMLVDAIEHSDLNTLQAVLNEIPNVPLDYLMILAYLRGSGIPILNFLHDKGASIENPVAIEALKSSGSVDESLGFRFISQAIDEAYSELFLELHKPVSALTLATSAASASTIDWLLAKGMSVEEQKGTVFNTRPLDHLFALQLARYKNSGARRPLNVEIVQLLIEAGAPVHPGQALTDLCQTPFVSRNTAEDEAWTRAAELLVENGAVFPPWQQVEGAIKKNSRSKRLLTLAADHSKKP